MCPVTCGLCDTAPSANDQPANPAPVENTGCTDSANNCATLLDYCNGDETKEMMQIQCKQSCGFCSAGPAPPAEDVCEDDPAINCGSFIAYCINQNTDVPKKCRRTCGLCPGMTPVTPAPITTRQTTTKPPATTQPPATTAAPAAAASDCKFFEILEFLRSLKLRL